MCKIVFSITFNVSFWCSKEPSHREDSFAHQKCVYENIIVDLGIISKLTSKLNIKKVGKGRPAREIPFEWHFASGTILVRHCVLAICYPPMSCLPFMGLHENSPIRDIKLLGYTVTKTEIYFFFLGR